ncbi:MAG: hypothetical protein EOO22_03745 [Comamonadaceae bacterium]|nr:MAG: hypothetical protein EOO22_03745 [Comamonadaceae bacterium]
MSVEPARCKALEALLGSLALSAPCDGNGKRIGSAAFDPGCASNCLFAFQPPAKLFQIYDDIHREAIAYANTGTEQGRAACTRLMAGLTRLAVRLPLDSVRSVWEGRPERISADAFAASLLRTWPLVLDRPDGVDKLMLAWNQLRQLVNDSPVHLADFMLSFSDEPLPVFYCLQGTFLHDARPLFESSPDDHGRLFFAVAAMLDPDKLRGYGHPMDLLQITDAIKNVIEHECVKNPVEFLPALLRMNKHHSGLAMISNYGGFYSGHRHRQFSADTWKKLHAVVLDTHADSHHLIPEATGLIKLLFRTGVAYDEVVLPSLVRALRVLDAGSADTELKQELQLAAVSLIGRLVDGDRSGNSELRSLCLRKMGSLESPGFFTDWLAADKFRQLSPRQRLTVYAELWEALPAMNLDKHGVEFTPVLTHLLQSIHVETATLDGFRLGQALRERASSLATLIEANARRRAPVAPGDASGALSVMPLLIDAAVQLLTLSESKRHELNAVLMNSQDPYSRSAPHDVLRQIHEGDHLELCHTLALGSSIASADREFKLRGRLIESLLQEDLSPLVARSIQRSIDGIGSVASQDASIRIVDTLTHWLCANSEPERLLAADVVEALLEALAGSANHLQARLNIMGRFFATSPGICYEHMEVALRASLDQLVEAQDRQSDPEIKLASQSIQRQLLAFHGFLQLHYPEQASAAAAPLFATLIEVAHRTSFLPQDVLESLIGLLEIHCPTTLPTVAVACQQWPGPVTQSLNALALAMTEDTRNASLPVTSSKQLLDMPIPDNFV